MIANKAAGRPEEANRNVHLRLAMESSFFRVPPIKIRNVRHTSALSLATDAQTQPQIAPHSRSLNYFLLFSQNTYLQKYSSMCSFNTQVPLFRQKLS